MPVLVRVKGSCVCDPGYTPLDSFSGLLSSFIPRKVHNAVKFKMMPNLAQLAQAVVNFGCIIEHSQHFGEVTEI